MREVGVGEQELDDPLRLDAADVKPLVGFVGRALLEHGTPLQVVDRQVGRLGSFEEAELRIQGAQYLLGPLQVPAELDEVPALVVHDGRLAHAVKEQHTDLRFLAEVVR